jgi:hypothetical protein
MDSSGWMLHRVEFSRGTFLCICTCLYVVDLPEPKMVLVILEAH